MALVSGVSLSSPPSQLLPRVFHLWLIPPTEDATAPCANFLPRLDPPHACFAARRCLSPSQDCRWPRCLNNMRNRANAEALPIFSTRLAPSQLRGRADESLLPCRACTSTRITRSGGVAAPMIAQHIVMSHLRPSVLLPHQLPTCQRQQALRYQCHQRPVTTSSRRTWRARPARSPTCTALPRPWH